MSSIVLGITALVAINSFNYNLVHDIGNQSKSLLGADLKISGNKSLNEELLNIVDSLPAESAMEIEMFSMAYIPSSGETQFVRIKAIQGRFPFYGQLNSEPQSAVANYQSLGEALVDEGLMLEQNLSIGDSIKLGEESFKIGGKISGAFGSISLGSGFAPVVYIPNSKLADTKLVKAGSMVEYAYFYKLPPSFDTEEWENDEVRRKRFRNESFRITTIEDQTRRLDRAFSSLNNFLNLIALVSLILGCIGVASSVLIYIKSKIPSIAVFRCIGMKSNESFWIYFLQISVLGFISVLIGAFLGSMIQVLLPIILKDVLPYEVDLAVSPRAIIEGIVIGSVITSLFSLVPLLAVRKISPLRTLRASFDEDVKPKDPLKYLVYVGIFISMILFLKLLTGSFLSAFIFTLGLIVSFLFLYGIATFIMWAIKRVFPRSWSFVFRQGLSNLYRPNNQTKTLIVSIGLGTSILTILFIIQGLLLNNVASMDAGSQPNMILYGIESNQTEQLAEITESYDMPVSQQVPIVTMRLAGWKGKTKTEWMADTTRTARRWAINREARVTYRDTLESDEKLLEGKLIPYTPDSDSIFVSLDQGFAENLDVEIGDELVWNVQGALITTYIGSLREIEFKSMRTRFFILFPTGVLENAPQFHVLVTKTPNNTVMAKYRREVVKTFPNVTAVDLGSILNTLNDILSKISYIIKFMAGFSILTGLIVLISSLLLSKFQRIKESVLLRTIGANRKQILKISATEYFILGIISASTGIIIAVIGSYLIATYQLDLIFDIQWLPIFFILIFITGLTVTIGLFNTRDVINKSPLEVLRKEVS
ncbi:MAG: FtsX-like permease family protein [Saprospiraceae bacterium]|nr:FtsX-like permease family protein [Bacteroidia bacterium]NNE13774.1 FtsX-like permease family protein [Saprospiraceae bacterium]NNL90682.1 FtsX-like permease family protein [Saprospiraceae bacterium]